MMQSHQSLGRWHPTCFWAMKLRSGVRRCFKVKQPFKITLATLETTPDSSSSDVVTLWYQAPAKDKLLLCTLGPTHPQQVLCLYFFARDVVTLYTCGHGTVNLIGYASVTRRSSSSDQFSSSSEQSVPVHLSEEDDSLDEVWCPNEARSKPAVPAGDRDGKRYRIVKAIRSKHKSDSTGGERSTSMSAESDEGESGEEVQKKSEAAVGQGKKQKNSKTVAKRESVKSDIGADKQKTRMTSSTKVKSKKSRSISTK